MKPIKTPAPPPCGDEGRILLPHVVDELLCLYTQARLRVKRAITRHLERGTLLVTQIKTRPLSFLERIPYRDSSGRSCNRRPKRNGERSPSAHGRRGYVKYIRTEARVNCPLASKDEESVVRVKVIDWDTPANNDFFLASQFWMTGETYKRRADLVGFVNGLPLVFIELKKLRTEDAFHKNLRDYKNTIPKLFWYNAFIILSHGTRSLIGSMTADLDHFSGWKRINDEGEQGIVSLDTMIRGMCEPARLLDIVENFTLFSENQQGLLKLIAKNHQYLGVSLRANIT